MTYMSRNKIGYYKIRKWIIQYNFPRWKLSKKKINSDGHNFLALISEAHEKWHNKNCSKMNTACLQDTKCVWKAVLRACHSAKIPWYQRKKISYPATISNKNELFAAHQFFIIGILGGVISIACAAASEMINNNNAMHASFILIKCSQKKVYQKKQKAQITLESKKKDADTIESNFWKL